MHERSLVKALLEQVAEIAGVEGNRRLTEIRLKAGPLAGVEPLLLASAFEDMSPGTIAAGAKIVIQEVKLQARCRDCGQDFVCVDFNFHCSRCNSTDITITEGDGVILESLTLSEPSPLGVTT